MSQFINYDDNAKKVMVYHTVPSKAGTPDFEHKAMVSLTAILSGKRLDGTENTDVLEVDCPVPGCGTRSWVPLTGGEEAQRLHAKTRWARSPATTYAQAVQSVTDDVKARGGQPALDPKRG